MAATTSRTARTATDRPGAPEPVERRDVVIHPEGPTIELPAPDRAELPVGATVEVRRRFDRRWARGFAVAAVGSGAYQVRRVTDGAVLPAWFPSDEVRPTP
jgi:hypothetical protein